MCVKLLTASAMVMVVFQVFAFAQADTNRAIDALDKALSQPSAPSPQSQARRPIKMIEGQWRTDWGDMTVNTIGGEINGAYSHGNGKLCQGRFSANVLEGFWTQDRSDTRCPESQCGSYYWGRFRFTFSDGRFEGTWDYCGNNATKAWNGQR